MIISWFNFTGQYAERISPMGRYIEGKTATNVLGKTYQFKGTHIPPNMAKGTADISAIYKGLSIRIEVKIGRDKQSDVQKDYETKIQRAGGIYFLATTYDGFIESMKPIMQQHNNKPSLADLDQADKLGQTVCPECKRLHNETEYNGFCCTACEWGY